MMTPKEKKVYREMFPERITWKGWWDGEDKTELLRYKNYSTCAWREGGKPKYTRAQLIKEWEERNRRPFCSPASASGIRPNFPSASINITAWSST